MPKPTVKTRCVANNYTGQNERIIEYTFPDGTGGLIQFAALASSNRVSLYQHDPTIKIHVEIRRK